MRRFILVAVAAAVAVGAFSYEARPASAIIHEIIGAACRSGGEEVVPPGQANGDLNSFLRALQASGVISSVVPSGSNTTFNFDLDRPNSKYTSAGFPVTFPVGGGQTVTLNPLPVLDPDFAAHAKCNNLNP